MIMRSRDVAKDNCIKVTYLEQTNALPQAIENWSLIDISNVRRLLCKEMNFLSIGERNRR